MGFLQLQKRRPIEITLLVILISALIAIQLLSITYAFYISELSGDFEEVINSIFSRRFLPFSAEVIIAIETAMSLVSLTLTVKLLKPSNKLRWSFSAWIASTVLYGVVTIESFSYSALHILGCIIMALALFNPRANRFYRQDS